MMTHTQFFGDIFRLMTGSCSAGFLAKWTNYRFDSRNFVWTSNSGPLSWVTPSYRANWVRAITLWPTRGGRGMRGYISPASTLPGLIVAALARNTVIGSLQNRHEYLRLQWRSIGQ